jgi:hypothetical protein
MATLLELVAMGDLVKLDPDLASSEFEDRKIYLLPQVCHWMEVTLPNLGSAWKIDISPEEQVDQFLTDFCAGVQVAVDYGIKLLRPIGHGVWELKTPDIRMFGWFAARDQFIISSCEATQRLKDIPGLYNGYINQAVFRRNQLDLNEPKFVGGDRINDVVSNWCYP